MSAIRSKNNRTELALRKALHSRGLRYRLHRAALPGKPDIVFPRQKVAVFVDGDYWHARVVRENGIRAAVGRLKREVRSYWRAKFIGRIRRDDEVTEQLEKEGWRVLRFWESDIRKEVVDAAGEIEKAVRGVSHRGDHL